MTKTKEQLKKYSLLECFDALIEESAEVIFSISKVKRFGLDDKHKKYGDFTMRELLQEEMTQAKGLIEEIEDRIRL